MSEQTEIERLRNLLARIHRDGGHYVAQHGLEKACKDADEIVANLYAGECELREQLERVEKAAREMAEALTQCREWVHDFQAPEMKSALTTARELGLLAPVDSQPHERR